MTKIIYVIGYIALRRGNAPGTHIDFDRNDYGSVVYLVVTVFMFVQVLGRLFPRITRLFFSIFVQNTPITRRVRRRHPVVVRITKGGTGRRDEGRVPFCTRFRSTRWGDSTDHKFKYYCEQRYGIFYFLAEQYVLLFESGDPPR